VKKITKPLLIILATLAVCMAGFQAMNTYTNYKAIPVTSNLMEPAIFRGSLMLMEKTPEKDLNPGDIIAVGLPNGEGHAVGRLIQSNQMADGYYNLTFKGDSRTLPEDFPYTIKDSTYTNKAAIPLLGFLMVFLASPFGLVLLVGASIYFAWYYLFKMHDRLSWAERNEKRVSYNRRVAIEVAENRQRYGGLDVFFPAEEAYDDNFTDSSANEWNESDTEQTDPSNAKEHTR
jgi:hypothetical protein